MVAGIVCCCFCCFCCCCCCCCFGVGGDDTYNAYDVTIVGDIYVVLTVAVVVTMVMVLMWFCCVGHGRLPFRLRYVFLRRDVTISASKHVSKISVAVTAAQSNAMEKLLGAYRLYVNGL